MYLTYQNYIEYGFNKVNETEFKRFEFKARKFIELNTWKKSINAIKNDRYKEDLQITMCLLIDLYKAQETSINELEQGLSISRKGIASESVTDHSVSFKDKSETALNELEKEYRKQASMIVKDNLMFTGLLYRGVL